MPELPEVETTRRGIAPLITGKKVSGVVVHHAGLRWPVPDDLPQILDGQTVEAVERRSKYLLVRFDRGTLIVHLGMTGHLRVVEGTAARRKHDHVEICFDDGSVLRFNDSRRFGALLWTRDDPLRHVRLAGLGPEPFDPAFDAACLHRRSRGRTVAVKPFLMDARTVVGVGNIYASEALFRAGIDPRRAAGRISRARYARLVDAVRAVLAESIEAGGTTIRDFADTAGRPGYFRQRLQVYKRAGEPCLRCDGTIQQTKLGQRATYFCPKCQS